jgi:hypothetical protein
VNLIDRDVDVHVVRVVMDDAHSLMFGVAQLLAKTLFDHPQCLGIGIFSGSERNEQMIGAIRFGARVQPLRRGDFAHSPCVSVETQLVIVTSPTLVFLPWGSSK